MVVSALYLAVGLETRIGRAYAPELAAQVFATTFVHLALPMTAVIWLVAQLLTKARAHT